MPYSVRFHGNYYLHGFSVVPDYPASHGCIRLPLREGDFNPARQFYEWVRIGTPIRVAGQWRG
jgi:lipoprotein-anchoring transpeptidase ErfK/SrfK